MLGLRNWRTLEDKSKVRSITPYPLGSFCGAAAAPSDLSVYTLGSSFPSKAYSLPLTVTLGCYHQSLSHIRRNSGREASVSMRVSVRIPNHEEMDSLKLLGQASLINLVNSQTLSQTKDRRTLRIHHLRLSSELHICLCTHTPPTHILWVNKSIV